MTKVSIPRCAHMPVVSDALFVIANHLYPLHPFILSLYHRRSAILTTLLPCTRTSFS